MLCRHVTVSMASGRKYGWCSGLWVRQLGIMLWMSLGFSVTEIPPIHDLFICLPVGRFEHVQVLEG